MVITGRFVLLALVAVVPIIVAPRAALAAVVTSAVLGLVAVAVLDLALAASIRRVSVRRILPASVRLTDTAESTLQLANGSSRPLRATVRDGWQPSAGALRPVQRLTIPAHGRAGLHDRLHPARRGDLRSEHVTVRSLGPLGLAGRQLSIPAPGVLRVLPPFHARRHLPGKLRQLRELDGRAAVQIRGAGTEFDSLRDYVRGDDVRSIDWRATASRRDVVVRTWRPERDRRVILVLDTSRTSAARIGDEPRLDTGIEAALLLAVLAERGGDKVSLLAFDRRPRARVASSGRGGMLGALVQALAPIQPELIELDAAAIPGQVRALTAHRALVVLLTSLDAGAAEEGLVPLVARLVRSHVVVVASVRDPQLDAVRRQRTTTTLAYRAAAAEYALAERAALADMLRGLGAEVVDAEPQELPPRLADAYIRLKATGRL